MSTLVTASSALDAWTNLSWMASSPTGTITWTSSLAGAIGATTGPGQDRDPGRDQDRAPGDSQ